MEKHMEDLRGSESGYPIPSLGDGPLGTQQEVHEPEGPCPERQRGHGHGARHSGDLGSGMGCASLIVHE